MIISVIPYQSNDGQEAAVEITTDKDGKATFTVTGSNAYCYSNCILRWKQPRMGY